MSIHFTQQKIEKAIFGLNAGSIKETIAPTTAKCKIGDLDRDTVTAPEFDDSKWDSLTNGLSWGSTPEVTAWIRVPFTIPENWKEGAIALHGVSKGCEILCYVDGAPISCLDGGHFDLPVADEAEPGATYLITLEAYSGLGSGPNPYFGADRDGEHSLSEAKFQLIDSDVLTATRDFRFALDVALTLQKDSLEREQLLAALNSACDLLDFRKGVHDSLFAASAKKADELLHEQIAKLRTIAPENTPTVWATGHAHIDTAWLWRIAHTRKKCQRTFTTQLDLMRRYPEYVFTCSQPQQYQFVKEDNPALYERIKEATKRGNWIPTGGMWVESDCNVPNGESLVRQFLYGRKFTKRELDFESDILWLPDVFGYSAALPQIIRKSGMKYFMTIKISWSQSNKPAYQTFNWIGIDGSKVLTHYPPNGDYNSDNTPKDIHVTWDKFTGKRLSKNILHSYGFGDGGGGATQLMIEQARRGQDFPGLPKVKLASPEEFFKHIESEVGSNPDLPTWRGELYLECHRGTLTSQAANKKHNRQSEQLLIAAEQLAAYAHVAAGASYPGETFEKDWQNLLLHQFHDIIPGSSITEVYQDSEIAYAELKKSVNSLIASSIDSVGGLLDAPAGSVFAYNPLSWARQDVAEAPASLGIDGQSATNIDGEAVTVVDLKGQLPSLGAAVIGKSTTPAGSAIKVSETTLENKFFKILLDSNAEIESIIDKRTGREVIDQSSEFKGNALQLFEDRPRNWDAWDIDVAYQDKLYPLQDVKSVKVVEDGPIRAGIEIERTVKEGLGSTVKQRIYIYSDLARIDFETVVDWKERETLLKAAFPVTIHSELATYDIQFGNVQRPTHWNTSWDWARFEVCGHKWADLSEGDYGVSLLSDSKYGWDTKDNTMRLTLLKGAVYPDPTADIGIHKFTYSLLPHEGDWRAAETVRRAYELNAPVHFGKTKGGSGSLGASFSFVSVDRPNIILETIKIGEYDDNIVVRAHEVYNQRGTATLTFDRPVQSAKAVNLVEEKGDGVEPVVHGSTISFEYGPYEIRTFKIAF